MEYDRAATNLTIRDETLGRGTTRVDGKPERRGAVGAADFGAVVHTSRILTGRHEFARPCQEPAVTLDAHECRRHQRRRGGVHLEIILQICRQKCLYSIPALEAN